MDRKVDDLFGVISFVLFCRNIDFKEIYKSTMHPILCPVDRCLLLWKTEWNCCWKLQEVFKREFLWFKWIVYINRVFHPSSFQLYLSYYNLVVICCSNFDSSEKKTNISFTTKSFSRIQEGKIILSILHQVNLPHGVHLTELLPRSKQQLTSSESVHRTVYQLSVHTQRLMSLTRRNVTTCVSWRPSIDLSLKHSLKRLSWQLFSFSNCCQATPYVLLSW